MTLYNLLESQDVFWNVFSNVNIPTSLKYLNLYGYNTYLCERGPKKALCQDEGKVLTQHVRIMFYIVGESKILRSRCRFDNHFEMKEVAFFGLASML